MIEKEGDIFSKVRRIEIKSRGLSSNMFAGQYHSAFKGRGMAFAEVREYLVESLRLSRDNCVLLQKKRRDL